MKLSVLPFFLSIVVDALFYLVIGDELGELLKIRDLLDLVRRTVQLLKVIGVLTSFWPNIPADLRVQVD